MLRRPSLATAAVATSAMSLALVLGVALVSQSGGATMLGSPVAARSRAAGLARAPATSDAAMRLSTANCGGPSIANTARTMAARAGRTAVRAKGERQVLIDKPLGLQLSQGANGLVVKSATGNAAKAGLKNGDNVIYTSSFFGDELWPSDKLSFTQSALKAAPSPVTVIVSDEPVDVKRLVARPAPKRFGKRLSAKQKELATHLCLDCGWIYAEETPFNEAPADFVCPQCNAGKKRFGSFDVATGKITEPISAFQIINVLIVVVGLAAVGFLGYFGAKLS